MGHDSQDDDSSAPVPAHERAWRHPSEVNTWQHAESVRATSPPPLSRRTTTVVALLSAACSVAVIAVAIPRNARDKAQEPNATPASVVVSEGANTRQTVSHSVVYLGDEGTPGIALSMNGKSVVVSAMSQVVSTVDSVVTVTNGDGAVGEATVLSRDDETGLVILSAPASLESLLRDIRTTTTPITEGSALLVFDPLSNALERVRQGISLTRDARFIPLDLGHAVPGATVVSNVAGEVVGVALERDRTTWLVPVSVLSEITDRAFAARETAQK